MCLNYSVLNRSGVMFLCVTGIGDIVLIAFGAIQKVCCDTFDTDGLCVLEGMFDCLGKRKFSYWHRVSRSCYILSIFILEVKILHL